MTSPAQRVGEASPRRGNVGTVARFLLPKIGQALFRTLYFLPSITPGVVVALVFYHIFGVWGQLLDKSHTALPALALLGVWS